MRVTSFSALSCNLSTRLWRAICSALSSFSQSATGGGEDERVAAGGEGGGGQSSGGGTACGADFLGREVVAKPLFWAGGQRRTPGCGLRLRESFFFAMGSGDGVTNRASKKLVDDGL